MQEVKTIAVDHRKKVQELNKNASKKVLEPRVKSKSPVIINSARASQKIIAHNINNVESQPQTKSPSPKN